MGRRHQAGTDCQDVILKFFFYAQGDPHQRSASGLLESFLYQLLKTKRDLLHGLTSSLSRKDGTNGARNTWEWHRDKLPTHLKDCLLETLTSSSLTLLVDAIDECEEGSRDRIYRFLHDLCQETQSGSNRFPVCVSCRPYPAVVDISKFEICVDKHNDKDIQAYLQQELDLLGVSRNSKSEFENNVVDRACGVFQWVSLIVLQIRQMHKDGASLKFMLNKVSKTPQQLDELYLQILGAIQDGEVSKAWRLLIWPCFAARPLTLDELRHAIVFDPQHPFTSLQEYPDCEDMCDDLEGMERQMRSLSKGLLQARTEGQQRVAEFVHQSVGNFLQRRGLEILLERTQYTSSADVDVTGLAHEYMSKVCLGYLFMEDICHSEWEGGSRQSVESLAANPFLNYAILNWPIHARHADKYDISQASLADCFKWPSNERVTKWFQFYRLFDKENSLCLPDSMSLARLSAEFNLCGTLTNILTRSTETGKPKSH